MLSQADIDRYGGKAAGLDYLSERTGLPVPPYVKKQAGSSMEPVLAAFRRMRKPVIVRSSSPYEFGDFEGIFTSVLGITDEAGLEKAVRTVEASALSERAKKYAQQHGYHIDGRMHCLVQEQSQPAYAGSMLGHPNVPDSVFMGYRGGVSEKHSFFWDGEMLIDLDLIDLPPVSEENRIALDAYEEVKESGLAEGYSILVEFGLNPFGIFQAQPFKPIEIAEFQVPELPDALTVPGAYAIIGTTSADGIAMPVVRTLGMNHAERVAYGHERGGLNGKDFDLAARLWNEAGRLPTLNHVLEWWNTGQDEEMGGPYCLVASSAGEESGEIDLMMPHMKAVILGHDAALSTLDIVGHSSIRLLKQARVVLYESQLYETRFFKAAETGKSVRIISNGMRAVAMLE